MTNRLIPAIALVLSVPLVLAGCSGADTGTTSPATDATVAATPDAVATTAASADPTDDVEIGNADDPFCAGALATIPPSDRLAAQGANTTVIASGTVEEINAWGETLVADTNEVLVWYDDGEQYIDDPAVLEAWGSMENFIRSYTVKLGEAAANATSRDAALTAMGELVADEAMRETLQAAPAAAQVIHDYTVERCPGITG